MRIPKRYGESRREACPFCRKQATASNQDGVPVCYEHKSSVLPEMKCACGKGLALMRGKFGAFFNCIDHGNQSFSKVFEFNEVHDASPAGSGAGKPGAVQKKGEPREIVVRADDPLYFS